MNHLASALHYLELFRSILPENAVVTEASELQEYGRDWRRELEPRASIILFPDSSDQVQKILRLCHENRIPVVPSGGRTGLSGGATALNGEVVLSLVRLNSNITVNTVDRTVCCDAGVVTQRVLDTVSDHGLFLPIDFASKGSSQIGGNVATNAGGIRVIRWGTLREWVLGLKVITADGTLLDLNGSLYKNQTGYDLRSLFIGSEGTLGVIVEATLRLTSPPSETLRFLCGIQEDSSIPAIIERVRQLFPTISMLEYFDNFCLSHVTSHHSLPNPLSHQFSSYLLVELEPDLCGGIEVVEERLASLLEEGLVADAVLAQNSKQATELLNYREFISESLSASTLVHKNDIAVPLSAIAPFMAELREGLQTVDPKVSVAVFGHLGDGNLHIGYLKPSSMTREAFSEICRIADQWTYALIKRYRGSISAEHGVGVLKKGYLHYSRSAAEIATMKGIKQTLDPHNILNPGKIFDL